MLRSIIVKLLKAKDKQYIKVAGKTIKTKTNIFQVGNNVQICG